MQQPRILSASFTVQNCLSANRDHWASAHGTFGHFAEFANTRLHGWQTAGCAAANGCLQQRARGRRSAGATGTVGVIRGARSRSSPRVLHQTTARCPGSSGTSTSASTNYIASSQRSHDADRQARCDRRRRRVDLRDAGRSPGDGRHAGSRTRAQSRCGLSRRRCAGSARVGDC